jgi:type VI secretion system secreted protein Hcp
MAYQFHLSIKGKTQGQFKGEGVLNRRKDSWIPALGFEYEIKSPRDAATGQRSGKRQHSPITIVKEWGAATPQIFTALVTNEVLSEVVFEFTRTNSNGEEYVFHKIKLTDGTVSQIKQFTGGDASTDSATSAKHTGAGKRLEMEAVSFTFYKIEVENVDGKTSAMDDWST